ncbi:hypothetical protein FQN60_006842, partial [Etheostoma spectabile]
MMTLRVEQHCVYWATGPAAVQCWQRAVTGAGEGAEFLSGPKSQATFSPSPTAGEARMPGCPAVNHNHDQAVSIGGSHDINASLQTVARVRGVECQRPPGSFPRRAVTRHGVCSPRAGHVTDWEVKVE